jgi:serine/threonine protein kinase
MGCGSSQDASNNTAGGAHEFKTVYKMGDELGQGAFSVVRLATNRETGKQFAVKIIKKDGLPHEDEVALHEEVNILKSLNHENIIRLYDFFDEAKFYYLVTELMDGGELFDRIVKKTYYNEKEARDLIRILLFAIKHLHDQDIVHRDLKPENLLLASQKDDADIKLADFGFAARVEGYNSLKTQCGTPGYVAPEILKNETYGKAVDMWSIGVITYILLGGYPPFHDENQAMLFRKIKNAQYQFHPDYWDPVS